MTRQLSVEPRRRPDGTDLDGLAVELALAAPFFSLRELDRCRARIAIWQRTAIEDAALLARLDGILARYTAGRGSLPTKQSA